MSKNTKHLDLACILPISFKLVKVTAPRVGTLEASSETVRNHTKEVSSYRSRVTGGKGTLWQLGDEIRALPQEEREELMRVFTIPVSISAENVLALKADLVIPWNKLRAMRRYANELALFPGSSS